MSLSSQPVPGDSTELAERLASWLAAVAEEATPAARPFFECRAVEHAAIAAAGSRGRVSRAHLAPPDGFEPPTPALGRLRSIH